MPITMTPVKRNVRAPVGEIHPDVYVALEEALEWSMKNTGQENVLEAATRELPVEKDLFLKQLRVVAREREPRVVVTGNSFKDGVRFRVDLYEAPAEAAGDTDATG
jgi:hypothetical protein